jgi:hypothetical protein
MKEAVLKRLAGKCKVPVGTVEKDYVLSLMLVILSNSDLASTIVFKGGTAIKKIYYPEARFSEDLDFDYFDLDPEDIKTILGDIPAVNPFESVEFLEIKDELLSGDKYSCRMNYVGPLKYRNSIKLDFSGKDRVLRELEYREIKDDYHSWEECACVYLQPGLQRNYREGVPYEYTCERGIRGLVNFTTFADCWTCDLFTPGSNLREKNGIQTMNIEEILAEKCRAFMMRSAPRDLYDILFLLDKGIKFDRSMVKEKLKRYREDWNEDSFEEKIGIFRPIWKRDLVSLLPEIPDFDSVVAAVRSEIRF